jgi:hypothetical protein
VLLYYIFLKLTKGMIMLKKALMVNAIFSLSSGICMLLGTAWLSQHIPLPAWAWMVGGIGLILFALQLVMMVIKPILAQQLTQLVVVSDIAWVVLTSLSALLFAAQITAMGFTLILAVNLVVGTLAVAQHRGYAPESRTLSPAS